MKQTTFTANKRRLVGKALRVAVIAAAAMAIPGFAQENPGGLTTSLSECMNMYGESVRSSLAEVSRR
ncbi:MAG: hypothetical protein GF344_20560, partial [Chitinivibrionales bacterium]|nr:hypothetical protein [Chitinivibrionales bacterium]